MNWNFNSKMYLYSFYLAGANVGRAIVVPPASAYVHKNFNLAY